MHVQAAAAPPPGILRVLKLALGYVMKCVGIWHWKMTQILHLQTGTRRCMLCKDAPDILPAASLANEQQKNLGDKVAGFCLPQNNAFFLAAFQPTEENK